MTRKRRRFSASFEAKVALAAIRGDRTTAELAAKFAVYTDQLGLSRFSGYYQPVGETAKNFTLMRRIGQFYLPFPFYGNRKIAEQSGYKRKRIQRLMGQMGIEAMYRKRRTTRRATCSSNACGGP